jgi:hypothetical protein
VRVPWDRALHQLGGVTYLRPELALLFKAGQDREKDREDLAAARLTPEGRRWLAAILERLGYNHVGGTDPPQPLAGEQEPGISPHVNGLNAYLSWGGALMPLLPRLGRVADLRFSPPEALP